MLATAAAETANGPDEDLGDADIEEGEEECPEEDEATS